MKKKLILISITLLIVIMVAGGSIAWFLSSPGEAVNEFEFGTVKVQVVEEGFTDINDLKPETYNKNVQVKNLGTNETYVRVRLMPEWSEPSLPVSNVKLNLSTNGDWTAKQSDGYYYFKYSLKENEETSLLLQSLTFTELDPEYKDENFTLKVVTEGVQITNEAWKDVWRLDNLPFTPDQPWTP